MDECLYQSWEKVNGGGGGARGKNYLWIARCLGGFLIKKGGRGGGGGGGDCMRNTTSNGNSAFNSAFALGRGKPRKGNRVGRSQNLVKY